MENLWIYLTANNLSIDSSSISNYLKCSICWNIMKHAMYSTCACGFCKNCIRDYFDQPTKSCPKCLNNGITVELNFERDLSEDMRSNRLISQLCVKCPISSCNEESELQLLLDHLRERHGGILECECKELHCESAHKCDRVIYRLECDVKSVKTDLVALQNVHNDVNRLTRSNRELRQWIEEKGSDQETQQLRDGLDAVKEELASLRAEKGADEAEMQTSLKQLRKQHFRLEETVKQLKLSLQMLTSADDVNERTCKGDKEEHDDDEKNETSTTIEKAGPPSPLHRSISEDQYSWRTTKMSAYTSAPRHSDPFTLRGYRFCLRHDWGQSRTTVIFQLCLLWSSRDNKLLWPLPHLIKLSVVGIDGKMIRSCQVSSKSGFSCSEMGRPRQPMTYLTDSIMELKFADHPGIVDMDFLLVNVDMIHRRLFSIFK